MIEVLEIRDFKGIKSLRLEPLKRINVLAGANDVGKTSVLEALYLTSACTAERIHSFSTAFRGVREASRGYPDKDEMTHHWRWLVRQGAPNASITIHAAGARITTSVRPSDSRATSGAAESVTIEVVSASSKFAITVQASGSSSMGRIAEAVPAMAVLSMHPSSPARDAELYNMAALRTGAEETIEQVLRHVDPRLKKLRFLQAPGTSAPLVHADVGIEQLVPSSQMGQGFNRVLNICCQILAAQASVVLVDEIETGIHHEALPRIWNGIRELCRTTGVQLFATTHSLECIRAAHEAHEDDAQYDFALHRLQRVHGYIEAVTHTREMLDVALNAPTPIEVR